MRRIGCVAMVLVLPLLSVAAETEAKKKPAMVGVQLRKDDDSGEIIVHIVLPDSPAEKAGLKSGDRILRINGLAPADLRATVQVVRALTPEKKAKFLIRRDGKEKTIEVVPVAVE
jgi:S1-C subfamily serine protease